MNKNETKKGEDKDDSRVSTLMRILSLIEKSTRESVEKTDNEFDFENTDLRMPVKTFRQKYPTEIEYKAW